MYVNALSYDAANSENWTPIKYWQYWDFARTFLITHRSLNLVFDSPFLDLKDEYSDYFIVYKIDGDIENVIHNYLNSNIVDIVPVNEITLDHETRKEFILTKSIDDLLVSYEWT